METIGGRQLMKKTFKIIIALVIIVCLLIVININNMWWLKIIGTITGVESTIARWVIAGVIDLIVAIIIVTISFKKFKKEGEDNE